uniref:Uncharacterized protein n=1 Tax=Rhipicephalus microplus TaxID=6941 RepID=A0A6G5A185_RHIMP
MFFFQKAHESLLLLNVVFFLFLEQYLFAKLFLLTGVVCLFMGNTWVILNSVQPFRWPCQMYWVISYQVHPVKFLPSPTM